MPPGLIDNTASFATLNKNDVSLKKASLRNTTLKMSTTVSTSEIQPTPQQSPDRTEKPSEMVHENISTEKKTSEDKLVEELTKKMQKLDKQLRDDVKPPIYGIDFTKPGKRRQRASTHLLNLGLTKGGHVELDDSSATNLITGECCGGGLGGGCCKATPTGDVTPGTPRLADFEIPQNAAFRSLRINLRPLSRNAKLSGVPELPVVDREIVPLKDLEHKSTCHIHPPTYVKPHPPHNVFSAKVASCRELTKPGAEKRTYHFDLDVTDYPDEGTNVDFVVGGAIGVCAPNPPTLVQEIFDRLKISKEEQDEPVLLHTQGGRWPTIWGEEEARTLTTTRRELLTWTVDVQSYAPKKNILRLLAEYAADPNEQLILKYLCSRQGQAAFCEYVYPLPQHRSCCTQFFCISPPPYRYDVVPTLPLTHIADVYDNQMPRFGTLIRSSYNNTIY
jgi:hypothetical protein